MIYLFLSFPNMLIIDRATLELISLNWFYRNIDFTYYCTNYFYDYMWAVKLYLVIKICGTCNSCLRVTCESKKKKLVKKLESSPPFLSHDRGIEVILHTFSDQNHPFLSRDERIEVFLHTCTFSDQNNFGSFSTTACICKAIIQLRNEFHV